MLSGMHAMHSFGGVLGAGVGSLAARIEAAPPAQFLIGAAAALACLAVSPLLLPSWEDPAEDKRSVGGHGAASGVSRWFRGWSFARGGARGARLLLHTGRGGGPGLVGRVRQRLPGRTSAALGAAGLGVFFGAVTLAGSLATVSSPALGQ